MTVGQLPIVVGLDTSGSATVALQWALDEARSCGAGVRMVGAYAGPAARWRPAPSVRSWS